MMSGPEQPPDVLPEWANQVLIALWTLLLGGRWLITPFLMTADPETAKVVEVAWDQRILLWGYLLLLIVTLTVAALRVVRGASTAAVPAPDSRK